MQDFIDMTKAQLAAIIGGMTAAQIKKASHADLVQMAGEKARPSDTPEPPTADNLTDLEKRVLVAHLEAGIDCNGAETLADMLGDNMTWSDVAETSQRTGLTKKQVSGVIASLSGKGLLDADVEKPNGKPGVDQVLTDRGVRIAFDLLGDGVVANPGPALPGDATPKQVKAVRVPAPKKARVLEDRVLVAPATDLKMVAFSLGGQPHAEVLVERRRCRHRRDGFVDGIPGPGGFCPGPAGRFPADPERGAPGRVEPGVACPDRTRGSDVPGGDAMTAPWLLFLTVTLGLVSGGGVAILTAPTAWVVEGRNAPRIMQAQACAMEVLQ